MPVIIFFLWFVVLVVLCWASETIFKRDCGRPGCKGWEFTHTGICSDCCQPVIGTSKAIRAWRRFKEQP